MIDQAVHCSINKEDIDFIQFPNEDVFEDTNEKKLRSYYLDRASQLGNLLKSKVNIYFKASRLLERLDFKCGPTWD